MSVVERTLASVKDDLRAIVREHLAAGITEPDDLVQELLTHLRENTEDAIVLVTPEARRLVTATLKTERRAGIRQTLATEPTEPDEEKPASEVQQAYNDLAKTQGEGFTILTEEGRPVLFREATRKDILSFRKRWLTRKEQAVQAIEAADELRYHMTQAHVRTVGELEDVAAWEERFKEFAA